METDAARRRRMFGLIPIGRNESPGERSPVVALSFVVGSDAAGVSSEGA